MEFGQKLRETRVKRGISQEFLAEQVNVSRQTISKWENNVVLPSAENLAKLSDLFQMPVEAFIKDDWIPPEEAAPAVQVVEVPVEVPVPEEVPVSRPKRRFLALLATLILAAGILVGAVFFRTLSGESASITETESRVIDESIIMYVPLLPPKS